MSLLKSLASEFRRVRLYKKLTQLMVAEKAGIGRESVSDIEAGKRNITVATIEILAKALGSEAEFILREKKD